MSRVVGYWYSKYEPQYPMPVAQNEPWENQSKFLQNLKKIQHRAGIKKYRGFSTCRICGCVNGIAEFSSDKFRWPSGLSHYVEFHNVEIPDNEFVSWVIGE